VSENVAGKEFAAESRAEESVAVVIPVFNGANYLAEALASVLKQTCAPDEILVIDDGSTDETVSIAESFPGVRVVSFENGGLAESRNRGTRLAASKWVAFLDHDDIWEPEKLRRQIELLRSIPDADICVTSRRYLNNGVLGKVQVAPLSGEIERSLLRACFFAPSSVVARRSVLLSLAGFDPSVKGCEDWDCWLRLKAAKAKFVSCPEALLIYRNHETNMSSDGHFMYRSELDIYDRLVSPQIHPAIRFVHRLRRNSELLASLGIMERDKNRAHLRVMFRSVRLFPFGNWKRYKIGARSLLKRAQVLR
jgi:glycosyltransferase involved in cell wall biosynthesis